MFGEMRNYLRTSTAGVVRVVQGRVGEQTKNQKLTSTSAGEAKEVERGR